ncbi:hypothetical protein GGI08_008232, partial [Coemansia sp. S2]
DRYQHISRHQIRKQEAIVIGDQIGIAQMPFRQHRQEAEPDEHGQLLIAVVSLAISASPTRCSRDVVHLLRLILDQTDPFSNELLTGYF